MPMLVPIQDYNLYNSYLKPVLWSGFAVAIWKLPKIKPAGNLKLRETSILWALGLSAIHVIFQIVGGLVDGFGNSPYNHSLKGIVMNVAAVSAVTIGREAFRSYIVNSMTRKENYLVFVPLALFMTVLDFSLNKYTEHKNLVDIVTFSAQFFAPKFSENIFATYLSFIGGSVPSTIYMGVLQAFHWLSPVLPDLKWITAALIGIMCPVFSLMVVQNAYLKASGIVKRKEREKDNPVSWIITSILSIAVTWFSVGVFPIYPSVIATGSMEPMIKPGDVILIKKITDINSINVGDVIQFKRGNMLISHRIIEITEDENGIGFRTKGDSNSSADSELVRAEDIKGKIVKVVPKIGWLTLLIKSNRDIPLDEIEF